MGSILQQKERRGPAHCPRRLFTEAGWKEAAWSELKPREEQKEEEREEEQREEEREEELRADRRENRTDQSCLHLQKNKPSENTQKSLNRKHSRMSIHRFQKPSKPPPPASDQAQSVPSVPRTRRHTDRCTPDPAPRLCTPDPAPRLRQRPHFTDDDSDTDLSESEKGSVPCGPPPQLQLRPEVIVPEQAPSRQKNKSKFDFPDFLPPPFNSWSLNQLAYFYHMEGRSRPRASGPLERYLERLIQLEWNQIKTQDTNRTTHTEPLSSRQKSPASSSARLSARLSAPKCILQCQRAFPFTVLSSGPSHCSYVVCTTRNSSCSCRPSKSSPPPDHRRPSRSSPPPEHRRPLRSSPPPEHRRPSALSKRSHSEGRTLIHRQRFQSPVQSQGHLQQMQAAGNIRTSIQTYNHDHRHRHLSNATAQGQTLRTEVRSSSGQRKGNSERLQNVVKRRGRSECRGERRAEVKPDAVQAIMEQLAAAKSSALYRPHTKQVAFVM